MGKTATKNPMVNHPVGNPGNPNPRSVTPRDQVEDWHDPYRVDGHYPDGTICSECGAVYHNQHWNWDDQRSRTLHEAGTPEVVCPACRKIDSADPQGVLTISGDYWPEHRDDLLNLLRNEAERGVNTNPLERIMDVREENGTLIVETTNEKLAQRLGRKLHQAHKGKVRYQWPQDNRLVRVYWERSLEA